MGSVFPVARFGTTAWVWTLGFVAAALFFGWRTLDAISGGRSPDRYDVGVALLLIVLIIYGWMRSVRLYRLTPDDLLIERWVLGKITLPLESINSIEAAPTLGSFFNVGILSNGGLFGWAGRAQVRRPGERRVLDAEVYGTNPANTVVVRLNNEQIYVLTPSNPRGLVDAVQSVMHQVQEQTPTEIAPGISKPKKSRRR